MKENKREGTFTCGGCLEEWPVDQLHEFDGRNLCSECFREETVVCSVCGERIWTYDNAGTAETPLCQRCYDHYYTSCDRCGALIRMEDVCYAPDDEEEEYPMCRNCYARMERDNAIQDYYYKPTPQFFGAGPRFFGVELEVDKAGESDRNAWELLSIANGEGEKRLYCKHDGSLNDGFELVSHPMSLCYHKEEMPWEKILHRAAEMGYTSPSSGYMRTPYPCKPGGLRQHGGGTGCSRCQDLVLFREELGGAAENSAAGPRDSWTAGQPGTDTRSSPGTFWNTPKSAATPDGIPASILQNSSTIEFRIFRGTLKYNTFPRRIADGKPHL